ncbi:hypothetical protein BUALT_Bualt15G0138500 [Buddleja alternifolia]|uniref:Retrotransposon gag domain-containing protein n=1 Tax=Buddleja alternifolia TaxID=168488 RepID=A0AAV6WQR4_9LAMI|nr:hypothetical protein BUALT_Bualt15G0138500 [Buddleja alternifolia]
MPPPTVPQASGIESSFSIPATRGTHHNVMGMNAPKRRDNLSGKHLEKFETCALLHQYTDGVKCRVFLTALTRAAQLCKKYQKTLLSLFNMHQGTIETLREYIRRFNAVGLEIPSGSAEMLANAFAQGLNDGEFFGSLAKKPANNFDNLQAREEKYIL